jgi:hypothetical protein
MKGILIDVNSALTAAGIDKIEVSDFYYFEQELPIPV